MANTNQSDSNNNFSEDLDDFINGVNSKNDSAEDSEDMSSFFEDLSDIDNFEDDLGTDAKKESEPQSAAMAPPPENRKAEKQPHQPKQPKSAPKRSIATESKQPKKMKKGTFLLMSGAIILTAIGLGGFYYWESFQDTLPQITELNKVFSVPEPNNNETIPEPLPDIDSNTLIVEPPKAVKKRKNPQPANTKKATRVPIIPQNEGDQYVQVAVCVYDNCKRRYQEALSRLGYPKSAIVTKNFTIKRNFVKFYIEIPMDAAQAEKVKQFINANNNLNIKSYTEKYRTDTYRVVIGLYPVGSRSEERMTEVESHLVSVLRDDFGDDVLFFNLRYQNKSLRHTKVLLGPYKNKGNANKALRDIQRINTFKTAFITRETG